MGIVIDESDTIVPLRRALLLGRGGVRCACIPLIRLEAALYFPEQGLVVRKVAKVLQKIIT
jgi:hypothetical protein